MKMPQRIGILFSCLILLSHWCDAIGEENDIEMSNAASTGKKQFDVIDVEQENRNTANLSTGETMRIITNGDVDDAFWVRHLGEDFKHAIHMQVGDANPALYELDQNAQASTTAMPSVQQQKTPHATHIGNVAPQMRPHQYPQNQSGGQAHGNERSSMSNNNLTDHRNSESNSMFQTYPSDNKHYPKKYEHQQDQEQNVKYRVHKFAPMHTYALTRNKKSFRNENGLQSSMVLQLPESEGKVLQVDDNQTPIVVKLPPVIYHSFETIKNGTSYKDIASSENSKSSANTKVISKTDANTNNKGLHNSRNRHGGPSQIQSRHPVANGYKTKPLDVYQAISYDSVSGGNSNNRIGRSSQDLFNKGL